MTYRRDRTEVNVDIIDVVPSTSIWDLGIVVGSCVPDSGRRRNVLHAA